MYHINKESIGNGENIALQNTAKHYFKKFDILGNSKQESREGYNELPNNIESQTLNGLTITTNKDKSITIKGTTNANTSINYCGEITLPKGEYAFDFKNTSPFNLFYTANGSNVVITANMGEKPYGSFVLENDTTVSKISSYVTSGQTIDVTLYPMIYKGSYDSSKPYEQYGASPSIEYEAPIESVGDNINLFDIETIQTGIFINMSTGETSPNSVWSQSDFILVKPNTTYTISNDIIFGGTGYLELSEYDETKKWLSSTQIGKKDTKSHTFTVGDNIAYVRIGVYKIGESVNNVKLSKGTTATPYSPYGQGSIEIHNCNENLFDKSKTLSAIGGVSGYVSTDYIPAKVGDVIKKNNKTTLFFYNSAKKQVGSTATWTTGTVTIENTAFIKCNVLETEVDTFMLVKNQELPSEYVQGQSQTKTLYTQQPFRAVGDVRDRIVKQNGVWYEEHNIYRLILDGTESWGTTTAYDGYYRYSFKLDNCYGSTNYVEGMNTHFTQRTTQAHGGYEYLYLQGTTAGGTIYIQVKDITTLDDFKTWLSENNVEVIYQLATPELIECTPEQVEQLEYFEKEAYSYDETTNIYSADEVSPYFEVTAYQRISEEFKTRLKEGKITRGYLKVLATDTLPEIIINENNYLKDLKIEELRYVPEEGIIGGAVAKRVSGNFNNVDSSFDIQDREIEVYLGVELEDEITEYIKYGTYIVQRPEDDQVNDNTSFEALDYMVKFNQEYKDRITYPCTLKQLLDDILDQAGVNSKVATFPNSDFIVENNQFEQGSTLRDVLKAITQVAFNWSRIDADDNLVMDFEIREETDEYLGTDDYFSFKKTDEYGPVNVVILRNSQVEGENVTIKDEESVLQHGEIEYVISDNPFAYTELKRKQLIEAGRRLFGLRYTPMAVDMLGLMYLNAKDRITVENLNGEKFNTYLLDHTIDYTGILLDSMQSQAKTKTETKYQYLSPLAQGLSHVEIKVDKANKRIESIVQTQEDVSEKVAKTVARIEVVYALSDSPTTEPTNGWSTTAPEWTAGKYMWQKTITTYANGTTAETVATNISGAKGEAGQNGVGIIQTNITYQKSTSGTTVPTGTWQTTIPEVDENGYLWTRTEFIYSDGSKKYAYNVGKKGATGIGVKSLVDQYYLSTSNTEQTGGEWTKTQPEWQDNTYIWTRTKINWTDNSITYTDPVLANTLNDINSNIVVLQEFKSSQITTNTSITNSVSDVTRRLNNDYSTTEQVDSKINGLDDKYEILEGRVAKTELSSEDFKISIETIKNQGVDKITTSMGYTFNDNGLNINRDNADTGTIVDEAGIQVVDKTGAGDPTDILYAGYVKEDNTKYADYAGQTIVATSNLIVKNFLVIGSNSRFQDYTNPILGGQGTGVYDI